MGRLTTHVLDTAAGHPASGLHIRLYRLDGDTRTAVAEVVTNSDGRADQPLLEGEAMQIGQYELVFAAGAYLAAQGVDTAAGQFLSDVPVRFHIADAGAHYHVPLLLSPYGYTTYRGS